MGTSLCSEVKLVVWVRRGSTKHRLLVPTTPPETHTQKHRHTHVCAHTCATYPDERVGSVADHCAALLRVTAAISGIRSQQAGLCIVQHVISQAFEYVPYLKRMCASDSCCNHTKA